MFFNILIDFSRLLSFIKAFIDSSLLPLPINRSLKFIFVFNLFTAFKELNGLFDPQILLHKSY